MRPAREKAETDLKSLRRTKVSREKEMGVPMRMMVLETRLRRMRTAKLTQASLPAEIRRRIGRR